MTKEEILAEINNCEQMIGHYEDEVRVAQSAQREAESAIEAYEHDSERFHDMLDALEEDDNKGADHG